MKIKPVDDRLLVKRLENAGEQKSAGGIIIPDTAKEKPQMGEVRAVGSDEEMQKLFKVGDKIIMSKYGGTEVTLDNEELLILSRSDILAIVE